MKKKTEPKEKGTKKKITKKLSSVEFRKKVLDLSGKGLTSEKIGEALRKQDIHPREHGKKISRILKEKNTYVDPDLRNVEKKLKSIEEHYEKNKQDKKSRREKDRIYAKLRKLRKYHKISIK